MDANELLALGLGPISPWEVAASSLDLEQSVGTLTIELSVKRSSMFPCPICGTMCKPHDFSEEKWQHLNFFQHRCLISAKVPRVKCDQHGIHKANVPWARKGSGFTLLFEQAVLLLCREMPVSKVAEITGVHDTRLWRVITHYIRAAINEIDLSSVYGIGVDETASKRGHNYVTVFVDMDREKRSVIFATPGKGKETFIAFKKFLMEHGGSHENVIEIVCDMSPAFMSGAEIEFPLSSITVDWFHVVQLFTRAVDEVRRKESKHVRLPDGTRWTILKGVENQRTEEQKIALRQLEMEGRETSRAFLIKEKLRWIRGADTKSQARWRIHRFISYAGRLLDNGKYLEPMKKALKTFLLHMEEIVNRWESLLTNARLEGLNSLFQAVRARARGYRNVNTFIAMIYLIGAPIPKILHA